jgi:transketolase
MSSVLTEATPGSETRSAFTSEPDLILVEQISSVALRARVRCIECTRNNSFGHLGPDFSAVDLISAIYMTLIRFPDGNLLHPERDRFVLSKGHAALALYSVLIELGWWHPAMLHKYGRKGGQLGGHPSAINEGIETCSGALGHGLPFGVGAALAARRQESERRIIVLVGDGELQEGSNWEAALMASTHRLDRLIVVVDRNGLQQGRATEDVVRLESLKEKWEAFGWRVINSDGHDPHKTVQALRLAASPTGRPTCILATTTKGKGVSFMENEPIWHHKLPNQTEAELALNELLRESFP